MDLLVSIVTYNSDLKVLASVMHSLVKSLDTAREGGMLMDAGIVLVDNGPGDVWSSHLKKILYSAKGKRNFLDAVIMTGHGNLGFGAGHNLAADSFDSKYYLVLNPDVILDSSAVSNALCFMEEHRKVGLLTPQAADGLGKPQFCASSILLFLILAFADLLPYG